MHWSRRYRCLLMQGAGTYETEIISFDCSYMHNMRTDQPANVIICTTVTVTVTVDS